MSVGGRMFRSSESSKAVAAQLGRVGDTMPFEIEFIEDSQLPEGIDWVQAADDRGRMFFVKRSRVCPEVLAEAWEAGTRFTVRAAS